MDYSKYIRTNKEIIDTTTKRLNFVSKEEFERQRNLEECGTIVSYIENDIWYCYCEEDGTIWKEKILKSSNDLKELCDAIIYVVKDKPFQDNYHKYHIDNVESFVWNTGNREIDDMYGAIWSKTISGVPILIPVAIVIRSLQKLELLSCPVKL